MIDIQQAINIYNDEPYFHKAPDYVRIQIAQIQYLYTRLQLVQTIYQNIRHYNVHNIWELITDSNQLLQNDEILTKVKQHVLIFKLESSITVHECFSKLVFSGMLPVSLIDYADMVTSLEIIESSLHNSISQFYLDLKNEMLSQFITVQMKYRDIESIYHAYIIACYHDESLRCYISELPKIHNKLLEHKCITNDEMFIMIHQIQFIMI